MARLDRKTADRGAAGGPAGERPRIPALDGLRGIAIAAVLLFHGTVVSGESTVEQLVFGVFRNFGWAGVDLFFVLSGFLITGILWDARGEARGIRRFYARRALRILPLYYGYLILVFALAARLDPDIPASPGDALFYLLYLQNFAIAAAGEWQHSRFLNLFWSLAIEEQFYLLWPWVVFALRRRALMGVCIGALCVSVGLRLALIDSVAPVALYVLTPTRLDGLAAGAFVALAVRGPGGIQALVRPAQALLAATGAGLLAIVVVQGGFSYRLPWTLTVGLGLLALHFASWLVLALRTPAESGLVRALSSRPLRALGRYSYALYVIHQAVLVFTVTVLGRAILEPIAPDAGSLAIQLFVYGVGLPLAIALAALSWRYYEGPFLALRSRLR